MLPSFRICVHSLYALTMLLLLSTVTCACEIPTLLPNTIDSNTVATSAHIVRALSVIFGAVTTFRKSSVLPRSEQRPTVRYCRISASDGGNHERHSPIATRFSGSILPQANPGALCNNAPGATDALHDSRAFQRPRHVARIQEAAGRRPDV